jgi:hypothetical protein
MDTVRLEYGVLLKREENAVKRKTAYAQGRGRFLFRDKAQRLV